MTPEEAYALRWQALARKEGHRPGWPQRQDKAQSAPKTLRGDVASRLRDLADKGHTITEAAYILKRSPSTIHKAAQTHGITFHKAPMESNFRRKSA